MTKVLVFPVNSMTKVLRNEGASSGAAPGADV